MKRNVYLNMKSREAVLALIMDTLKPTQKPGETIPVNASVGRILSEPVFARTSAPPGHLSAMDGVAVKAALTFGASETAPIHLTPGKNAFYVNTGNALPEGCNAVIMIENIIEHADTISIEAPVFPWQNVRKAGEDIVATELLFPRGHRITPYCIGALIAAGIFKVTVVQKPIVLMIPTGNEVKNWEENENRACLPGDLYDANTYMLGAMAERIGADYVRHAIVDDDITLLTDTITRAASGGTYDAILIIGGSSAGSHDFTRKMISNAGVVHVHGVAMMPGKPFVFGEINTLPVFGIPGYPVSAIIAFESFIQPLLERLGGRHDDPPPTVLVECARKMISRPGIEQFLRVKIGCVGDKIIATPVKGGAGAITSITQADGIIQIPAGSEGINAGDTMDARLLTSFETIRNCIVINGSHDNTLDLIENQPEMVLAGRPVTVSSTHTGSLGGLMALKKGICHMAGSHLLDTKTGAYNVSWVKKYLKDKPVRLVNLVIREQGLIVPKGNPHNIRSLSDIADKKCRFINRQAGSGTRILLDYKLNELGIAPDQISGYDMEEYTHMSVAVNILSGAADTGLGIYAAARALDLDFIPIVTEQYDLVIDALYFNDSKISCLLNTINSGRFQKDVEQLGGYSTKKTGSLIEINDD